MNEADIKANWYYFRSLSNQLHRINRQEKMLNASTFSNEFAKILMLASSEFEVISKLICREAGIKLPWNANIVSITKTLLLKYPKIGDTKVYTPYIEFQPLKEWKIIKEK
ncbi:hypothetical protein [Butyrivibrio sp. MB2005]|uniref:hypothetical protein n=1 Tax=Butyrivibrio sp. MB2005 TaxID=1280678 RepID=UPI00047E0D6F|nr:hypothetical protein [Butyrivibrio sp. MB2005]